MADVNSLIKFWHSTDAVKKEKCRSFAAQPSGTSNHLYKLYNFIELASQARKMPQTLSEFDGNVINHTRRHIDLLNHALSNIDMATKQAKFISPNLADALAYIKRTIQIQICAQLDQASKEYGEDLDQFITTLGHDGQPCEIPIFTYDQELILSLIYLFSAGCFQTGAPGNIDEIKFLSLLWSEITRNSGKQDDYVTNADIEKKIYDILITFKKTRKNSWDNLKTKIEPTHDFHQKVMKRLQHLYVEETIDEHQYEAMTKSPSLHRLLLSTICNINFCISAYDIWEKQKNSKTSPEQERAKHNSPERKDRALASFFKMHLLNTGQTSNQGLAAASALAICLYYQQKEAFVVDAIQNILQEDHGAEIFAEIHSFFASECLKDTVATWIRLKFTDHENIGENFNSLRTQLKTTEAIYKACRLITNLINETVKSDNPDQELPLANANPDPDQTMLRMRIDIVPAIIELLKSPPVEDHGKLMFSTRLISLVFTGLNQEHRIQPTELASSNALTKIIYAHLLKFKENYEEPDWHNLQKFLELKCHLDAVELPTSPACDQDQLARIDAFIREMTKVIPEQIRRDSLGSNIGRTPSQEQSAKASSQPVRCDYGALPAPKRKHTNAIKSNKHAGGSAKQIGSKIGASKSRTLPTPPTSKPKKSDPPPRPHSKESCYHSNGLGEPATTTTNKKKPPSEPALTADGKPTISNGHRDSSAVNKNPIPPTRDWQIEAITREPYPNAYSINHPMLGETTRVAHVQIDNKVTPALGPAIDQQATCKRKTPSKQCKTASGKTGSSNTSGSRRNFSLLGGLLRRGKPRPKAKTGADDDPSNSVTAASPT